MRYGLGLFIGMLLVPMAAMAAPMSPKPVLQERVRQREVLADPVCVKQKGEVAECYCVADVAFPAFIAKGGLKNARKLTELLEAYRDENIDDGYCNGIYKQPRKVKATVVATSAGMLTMLGFTTALHKGPYVGVVYQFEEREEGETLRYRRGIVVDTAKEVVLTAPLLLGAHQDALLSDAATKALRAQVPNAQVLKFVGGTCTNCTSVYVTDAAIEIEIAAGTVAPFEQGELRVQLPLSYIHHAGLRKALGVR